MHMCTYMHMHAHQKTANDRQVVIIVGAMIASTFAPRGLERKTRERAEIRAE